MGAIVGIVVSSLPDLQVGILGNQVILSADSLYITESIFNEAIDVSLSGTVDIDNISKSISGDVIMKVDSLKKGDFVMLVPAGSGQEFFVVDKVRKVK